MSSRKLNGWKANALLWTLQVIITLLFLFAGSMKLILPAADLAREMPSIPILFVRVLGVVEILSALGVTLPGILNIRPVAILAACASVVIIMIGAVGATVATGGGFTALGPVAIGLVAAFIGYGRGLALPARVSLRQAILRRAA